VHIDYKKAKFQKFTTKTYTAIMTSYYITSIHSVTLQW